MNKLRHTNVTLGIREVESVCEILTTYLNPSLTP